MNPIIRLRKSVIGKVFPDNLTKMRMEDFTSKAIDNKKFLNKREFDALINFRGKMGSRYYKEGFEFIANKKKDRVEFIRMDN